VEFALFTTRGGLLTITTLLVLFGRSKARALGAEISETPCCGGCDFLSGGSWMDIMLGVGLCLLLKQ
jgi:hypothetical protein